MNEARPPEYAPEDVDRSAGDTPTRTPPVTATGSSRPDDLTQEDLLGYEPGPETLAEPTRTPPAVTAETAAGEGAGTWWTGDRVLALWSKDESRNAWIFFQSARWRRVAPVTDSGVVAVALVAAHAKLTGGSADFREDSAQNLLELYAW